MREGGRGGLGAAEMWMGQGGTVTTTVHKSRGGNKTHEVFDKLCSHLHPLSNLNAGEDTTLCCTNKEAIRFGV